MKDTEIIAAVHGMGDGTAIAHAMDRYGRLLWKVVGAVLLPWAESDAEECVADVFIELWQHPERFDPGRGTLKTWLTLQARSRALDRSRQLARRAEAALEEQLPARALGLEESLLAAEQRAALFFALQTLSDADRDILLRRYAYGQKPRQIAQALDLTVKQVENRLYFLVAQQ